MTQSKFGIPHCGLYSTLILTIIATVTATPVIANSSNFEKIILSPGFEPNKGRVTGYTKGSFPLHNMSKRDQKGNHCTGFATPTPDHIMILKKDFSNLELKVNSGRDTTLLILGPDKSTIRCGDDTGKNKDASITDNNWKAGPYKIWVGNFKKNSQTNYSLLVKE
ncbi:hypothetical protein [Calothrix rhizosoleniae]|uniref:hypothetical protein n=1 Tax=Calothrix rhizosoleniae TaxID=888997 RepID=UPI000B4A080F|nr:hypothetical protein [Calothrix rhizosoleniae]